MRKIAAAVAAAVAAAGPDDADDALASFAERADRVAKTTSKQRVAAQELKDLVRAVMESGQWSLHVDANRTVRRGHFKVAENAATNAITTHVVAAVVGVVSVTPGNDGGGNGDDHPTVYPLCVLVGCPTQSYQGKTQECGTSLDDAHLAGAHEGAWAFLFLGAIEAAARGLVGPSSASGNADVGRVFGMCEQLTDQYASQAVQFHPPWGSIRFRLALRTYAPCVCV